jgi:hypothetical protein
LAKSPDIEQPLISGGFSIKCPHLFVPRTSSFTVTAARSQKRRLPMPRLPPPGHPIGISLCTHMQTRGSIMSWMNLSQ